MTPNAAFARRWAWPGVRLEADVHIVTGAIASAQNIATCCKRAGLTLVDLILEPLASAESVLTRDEMELGVILLDFGGGHNGYGCLP